MNVATNVDRACRSYTDAVDRIREQHKATVDTAERRASDTVVAAQEKLIAAKRTHDTAVSRAEKTLEEVRSTADTALHDGEQRATDEFDQAMRKAVGAPAGARLRQVGVRLVLDLGDGRTPIAAMVPAGGGHWQVEGADEPVVIYGDAMAARVALWQRCRPAMQLQA